MGHPAASPYREVPPYAIERASGARLLGIEQQNLVAAVRGGLSYDAFGQLRSFLDVPVRVLSEVIRISPRTLARRKRQGHLTPEESDRLARAARLAEMALVVFEGNGESTAAWLKEPKALMRDESPLRHSDTEAGAREVEDMLYAIEFTAAA